MTDEAQDVKVKLDYSGLGINLTQEQAEIVAARILEEGLKITLLTILEVIAVLWVTS